MRHGQRLGATCALRHDQRLEISPRLWRPPLVVDQVKQVWTRPPKRRYLSGNYAALSILLHGLGLKGAGVEHCCQKHSAAMPCIGSAVMDQLEKRLVEVVDEKAQESTWKCSWRWAPDVLLRHQGYLSRNHEPKLKETQ